ncbi:MAG: inorganic phosphate transporter [Anaerolineales bacterium]|nr:inorganic phosphate transporter [Anaerolineales bacterium]
MPFPFELLLVILLALIFEFINGGQSSGNIVATMISSRAFPPRLALSMTVLAEFAAPFLFGTRVAKTIGDGIVEAHALTLKVLIACLLGSILWNAFNWLFGIPNSSTHSLVGGLLGSIFVASGTNLIRFGGLYGVLLALLLSPFISFTTGFLVLRAIYFLTRNATPKINGFFRRAQLGTALALAFSYGANDAQKTMGLITLGLVISGALKDFTVPTWVILLSISSTALGTLLGGWRSIRTLGGKFYKIQPVHSFAAQLTSGLVSLAASLGGFPVSTSQVVSSSIIGIGASERLSKVRWGVAGEIITTWIFTIPASAALSALIYLALNRWL